MLLIGRKSHFRKRAQVAIALAAFGLYVGAGNMPSAQAAVGCRADPIVTLPNGISVDLHVDMSSALGTLSLADVQHITYVLHGSKKDGSAYTLSYPDGTGAISSLTYLADAQPNQYYADVLVTMRKPSVSVTGYLDWTAGGKHNSGTASVTGTAGAVVETPVLRIVCANMCS